MMRLTNILKEGYKEIDELERLADMIIQYIVKVNLPRFEAVYKWREDNIPAIEPSPRMIQMLQKDFSDKIRNGLHFSNPTVRILDAGRKGKWNVIDKFIKEWQVSVEFSDKASTPGVYASNPSSGSKIYIKLDYPPFADLLAYNIDFDLSKGRPTKSKVQKAALLCMGAIFRTTLLHELQHAYDDWRSSGKYTQNKQQSDYLKQYGGKNYMSGGITKFSDEQLGKYYALPHEYWARFSEAVREIFGSSDNFRKPFTDIIRKFKQVFRGYDSLPEAGQRRLWKALYKYYTEKGQPKIN